MVYMRSIATCVCDKNTPLERKTLLEISLDYTESGAGEHFLCETSLNKHVTPHLHSE